MNAKKYTAFGILAVLLWGMSAAFTRTLGERLGAFTSGAVVNILAGVIGILALWRQCGRLSMSRIPKLYMWVCGPLYILYVITSYVSTTIAQTRQQVVVVVVIKFLWPIITMLLTIPILKARASRWLCIGLAICVAGMLVVNAGDELFSVGLASAAFDPSGLWPYLLGFASAVAWALYSVLMRKFLAESNSDCDLVCYFMLATGILMGVISLFVAEPRQFGMTMTGELFFQVVLSGIVATTLWNVSMRSGNIIIVLAVSNCTPVIGTLATALVLGVPVTLPVVIGSMLIVVGTMWSERCFRKADTASTAAEEVL